MKQFIRFIFSFFLLNISTYSQPEFQISIDHIKWENPSGNKIDLTIFLKIYNNGNEKGKCEDLYDLYLDCSYPYSAQNIKLEDNSNNILNIINAGSFVESYITFEVPKDADDLTLRFYGGASKYITVSYNKWLENEKNDKFNMFVSEGDLRMMQNYPEEAITQYKSALEVNVDKSKRDEVKKKLSEAYFKIGDKYYDGKIWNFAIDNYKLSLENNYSTYLKEKIAYIYKLMGDEKYSIGAKKEALEYYDTSLRYKEDTQVRLRKNEIITDVTKKDKKEKKFRNEKARYQQLLNPKVGVKLGGGISYQTKDGGKEGAPFWAVNLSVIPKIYVGESSPFSVALNTEFCASGLITGTSNKSFTDYYNFGDSIVSSEKALSNEFSLNVGIGLGYLSNSTTPLLLINYGVYALNLNYSSQDINSYYSSSSSIDAFYWGSGPKVELNFVFGRKFYLGYSFKSYTISTNIKNFDGTYSGHNISLGLMLF